MSLLFIIIEELFDIIQFLLNVSLYSVTYGRSANLVLSLIFSKELINKFANEEDESMNNINNKEISFFEQIENTFIDFIHTALDLYISNITNQEDKFILETPYDIMTQNFENVNLHNGNKPSKLNSSIYNSKYYDKIEHKNKVYNRNSSIGRLTSGRHYSMKIPGKLIHK